MHIEAGQLFPLATDTLLRGALLGAAQTVWMLAPDDQPTRLDYARTAAAEMLRRHREWLSDLRRIDPEPHANTELVYAHVVKREKELAAKRAGVGQARDFVATSIIERAAAVTSAQSPRLELCGGPYPVRPTASCDRCSDATEPNRSQAPTRKASLSTGQAVASSRFSTPTCWPTSFPLTVGICLTFEGRRQTARLPNPTMAAGFTGHV